MRSPPSLAGLAASLLVAACGPAATLPVSVGYGPHPILPPPRSSLIPTVLVVEAVGWPAGMHPTSAAGTTVTAFVTGLDHPRSLYMLPNGDVLVAETNAPPGLEDGKGIEGWFFRRFQRKAGAGVAEMRSVFLSNLTSPFGMALVGNTLYVANSDAIVRFPYERGQTQITAPPVKVVDLPGGPINHHWTKNLVASPDGTKLYAA